MDYFQKTAKMNIRAGFYCNITVKEREEKQYVDAK